MRHTLVEIIRRKSTENGHGALESRDPGQISKCVARWGKCQGARADLGSECLINCNCRKGSSAPCKKECYQVLDSTTFCRAPRCCSLNIGGAPDRIFIQEHHPSVQAKSDSAPAGRRVRFQCFWGGWFLLVDTLILAVKMSRNPVFYVTYILIPCLLMAGVSVMVFLLPPESGERIGLSITVMLSYTVFLLMVSEFTPRGGRNTAFLGNFIYLFFILRVNRFERYDERYLDNISNGRLHLLVFCSFQYSTSHQLKLWQRWI